MNLLDKKPDLAANVFVAPSASVIGDVKLGTNSSVFYGSIVRGDAGSVTIGEGTNIQDACTVRTQGRSVEEHDADVVIGRNVTIGHSVSLHGCTIKDEVLIGMGASVGCGATLEKGSMVAAGAVVLPATTVPAGQVWGGNPAKLLRSMKKEEMTFMKESANHYVNVAKEHLKANSFTLEEIARSKGMVA